MAGRIIPLPFDPHRKVEGLLPWYVRGQLEPEDHELVEAHVARCAECREELAFETRLAQSIDTAPPDPEEGWARMRAQIAQQGRGPSAMPAARPVRARWGALAQPAHLGWAMAASALLLVGGAMVYGTWTQPDRYHALASAKAPAAAGNLVVIFKPETSEAAIRAILKTNHARIVDGPSAADAYVLAAPKAERDAILARLRGDPALLLAEPVDGTP
jgi:anti-sigma factor RsiW